MAWPGKAVFDVSIMAGWAFVALFAGLIALMMVNDSVDDRNSPRLDVAQAETDGRIVTGAVKEEALSQKSAKVHTSKDDPSLSSSEAQLIDEQNRSYNPFKSKQDENAQQAQMKAILDQLKSLQREVDAFNASTKKLRDENAQLKHRLDNMTFEADSSAKELAQSGAQQVGDGRSPIVLQRVNKRGLPVPEKIDTGSTGSIAPQIKQPSLDVQRGFDPFNQEKPRTSVLVEETPFDMDLDKSGASQRPSVLLLQPESTVIETPPQVHATSYTTFGLDLGAFSSLSELRAAWKSLSIAQPKIVRSLTPLGYVSENKDRKLVLNLRLGPIPNAAYAATLCANLHARGYDCKVSVYQGQSVAQR